MEKAKYTAPETEIVEFETTGDPIATSNINPNEANELPIISDPKTI